MMGRWLAKTEPEKYSLEDLRADGSTSWDGVRNPLAQQYLRQMAMGDSVLIYHSGKQRAVVGLAEVVREAYLDPTDDKGRCVCVEIKFVEKYDQPVSLAEIKAGGKFKQMALVKMSRLSVMPVTRAHWNQMMRMAGMEP